MIRACCASCATLLACILPASAEPIRVATFNIEQERRGPGLLLRDLRRGGDPGLDAAISVIAEVAPDILVLQGVDYDLDGLALGALSAAIGAAGVPLSHSFAGRPNTGMATGLDMDGNGRLGEARDAQGYGRFAGQGGMAVLSRFPIDAAATRDFSEFLWRDLPDAIPPVNADGTPFPDAGRFALQRLSSVAHWDVAIDLPGETVIRLLTWHATPPVFDGPEDRNGRRNHDEAAFWLRYLAGDLPFAPPDVPFVVLGDANLDTVDGDGRAAAMTALLSHPQLQDIHPRSPGGPEATQMQGGVNTAQMGDPAFDTADWDDDAGGPGNLRVDYILPSTDWRIVDGGVFWPTIQDPDHALLGGEDGPSRHRLVWVDLDLAIR